MSEENNNSNNDLSREELNEELDKVKQSNRQKSILKKTGVVTCYRTSQPDEPDQEQEDSDCEESSGKTSGEKKRSRWGCLIGALAAIGGLFLFWKAACRPPFVMCYSPVPDRNRNGEDVRPTCYEIVIPDDNDAPVPDFDPADFEPSVESPSSDAEAEAAAEAAINDLQEYYEKVKRESPVNYDDNDAPTEE